MITSRGWGIALLCVVLSAGPARAQEAMACEDNETVQACYGRLYAAALGPRPVEAARAAVDTTVAAARERLARTATGPNVTESLAQSAIRDFLPRFAGTLLTSNPTEDLPAIDVRFNAPVGTPGRPRVTLQAGLTLHEAELYEPLVEGIPESIRKESEDRLKEELEDGDDATAFLAANVESRTLGRDFAIHAQTLGSLANAALAAAEQRIGSPPNPAYAYGRFSTRLGDTESIVALRRADPQCMDLARPRPVPNSAGSLQVSCLTPAVRAGLDSVLVLMARYTVRRALSLQRVMETNGLERLASLVNNQPQLNFTAEYRSRAREVGPEEWSGRLRFETGFANLNALRSACGGGEPTLACLSQYTQRPRVRRSLARGDRLWLEGQVRYRPAYRFALPADSVTLSLDRGVGFGVSGGYGFYLGSAETRDEKRDRIDLHASYDRADGEDLRQSRFLAGAFYTLRATDLLSGVVGLVWADRAEYVGDADRHLGARLGLSYKLTRKDEK